MAVKLAWHALVSASVRAACVTAHGTNEQRVHVQVPARARGPFCLCSVPLQRAQKRPAMVAGQAPVPAADWS